MERTLMKMVLKQRIVLFVIAKNAWYFESWLPIYMIYLFKLISKFYIFEKIKKKNIIIFDSFISFKKLSFTNLHTVKDKGVNFSWVLETIKINGKKFDLFNPNLDCI